MIDQTSRQLLRTIARWDRRLRLTQLSLWIPRGMALGLVAALVVALAFAVAHPLLLVPSGELLAWANPAPTAPAASLPHSLPACAPSRLNSWRRFRNHGKMRTRLWPV